MAVAQSTFFRYIDENFGHNTVETMKSYATNNKKLAHLESRKSFLVQCRRQGVFPRHIINSFKCVHELLADNGPYINKIDRTIRRFKKAILNLEIKQTFHKIRETTKDMDGIMGNIRSLTSDSVAEEYSTTQRAAYNKWLRKKDGETARKVTKIVRELNDNGTGEPSYNERAILNATGVDIPAETLHLLSLGPKFALPTTSPSQVPFYHFLADTERILLTNGDQNVQNRNRCKVVNATQNFIHGFHSMVELRDSTTTFCERATNTTKQFLRAHPEVCVLSADKGNRTVIMLREDYDRKMQALVNDTTTYEKLRADPTTRFQNGNNNIIKRLKDLHLIDNRTANELKANNSICPRIYGQPKAHKQDLPLRPVIPNITAPTYKLAKYIANILQNSLHSRYSTRSSFEFCDEVNNIKLPEGYIIISLDVTSLFTNVPRWLVTRNIIHRWNEIDTNINLDLFLEIVEFVMEASYFCYDGQFYKQTFGTAMGSPLSPILADIVLDSVIDAAMESLPFEITIFKKYVDDIFMAIPQNTEQQVLVAFNKVEPRLQFTIEAENERRLPFLDMTVIRNQDQTLATEWYAKPIASGRMLNYNSFHQPKHKINVANNFIHRVCSLTRNKSMNEIGTIIHQHLLRNNYPKQLINRLLNLYINKRRQNNVDEIPTASITELPNDDPSQPSCQPPNHPPSQPSCQPPNLPPSQPSCQLPSRPPSQPLCQPPNQLPDQPTINHTVPQHIPHQDLTSPTNHQTEDSIPDHHITNPMRHPTHGTEDETENPHRQNQTVSTTQQPIYRSIPYVPSLSDRVTKILSKDYPEITIATRQHRTVKNLHSKIKFPVKKDEISNIIYKIPCNDCDACYIGMTRNNLRKRLTGHRANVNKLDKLMNDEEHTHTNEAQIALIETTTALIEHCITQNHRFQLDHTNIIDHSHKPSTLPFLEMCHITNTDKTVNKRTDTDGLNTTYAGLLHDIKTIYRQDKSSKKSQTTEE
ncbi:uncharacterized protein LOC134291688 [Aedes albopictus]|uniref:Reverse transcriptase domain-containing protein n=1 Tax=Aedes albopictus TaxID=7160 RepID=A0ABM1Z8Q3_AEDAL